MNELKPTLPENLYDSDFYAWSGDQARRLRLLKPEGFDWANVAEEIESLGKSEKHGVASNLSVVLRHLIKWRYQPSKRSSSWIRSIDEHRDRIERSVADSPSLMGELRESLADEYRRARRSALRETRLSPSTVPETCPFSIEQVLDPDYLP
jgi:hypothetical protein